MSGAEDWQRFEELLVLGLMRPMRVSLHNLQMQFQGRDSQRCLILSYILRTAVQKPFEERVSQIYQQHMHPG